VVKGPRGTQPQPGLIPGDDGHVVSVWQETSSVIGVGLGKGANPR